MKTAHNFRIRMVLFAGLFLAAGLCRAAFAEGPSSAGRYKGYNLLMLSITNIGARHMSLYGYKRKTTPNLDKWAAGALVFEDAFSPASWTLPVATSLFTSLYPYTHKIMGRERNMLLSKKIKTLPEILKASGYNTAAFTGGLDYMRSLGHMRGFGTASANPPFTRLDVTIPQAGKWLSENRDGRFFLFVHGYDAHPPFIPSKRSKGVFSGTEGRRVSVDPLRTYRGYREAGNADMTAYYHEPRKASEEETRKKREAVKKVVLTRDDVDYLRDLYDETILDADRAAGEFLASLDKGLLDRTIIVIVSEHGEIFGEHGRLGRGGPKRGALYDDVSHVPLMIRIPGAAGGRLRGLAQMVDVMPTLLEMLGVPAPGKVQGVSLLPLVDGGRSVNEFAYAGAEYNPYRTDAYPFGAAILAESIRDDKWKLIHETAVPGAADGPASGRAEETFELYDIRNDAGETSSLAASHPDIVGRLKLELRRWAVSSREFMKAGPSIRNVPGEILETAKQHGYW